MSGDELEKYDRAWKWSKVEMAYKWLKMVKDC